MTVLLFGLPIRVWVANVYHQPARAEAGLGQCGEANEEGAQDESRASAVHASDYTACPLTRLIAHTTPKHAVQISTMAAPEAMAM
jgi:hypothetical protein